MNKQTKVKQAEQHQQRKQQAGAVKIARWGRLLAAKAWRDEFKSQFSLEKPGLTVCTPHSTAVAGEACWRRWLPVSF